jgi:hypothetical protein
MDHRLAEHGAWSSVNSMLCEYRWSLALEIQIISIGGLPEAFGPMLRLQIRLMLAELA